MFREAEKDTIEILRLTNKKFHSICGTQDRLIQFLIKESIDKNLYKRIRVSLDPRYDYGHSYERNGFKRIYKPLEINCWYTDGLVREDSPEKINSEFDICKIYGCGAEEYELNIG